MNGSLRLVSFSSVLVGVATCVLSSGYAHALAITSAAGGAAQLVYHGGRIVAGTTFAEAHDAGPIGSWSAEASITVPPFEQDGITIRAQAEATRASFTAVSTSPSGGGAVIPASRAFARWIDELTFHNPDVLDAQAFTGFFVYFLPSVDGHSSGHTLTNFEVVVDGHVRESRFTAPGEHQADFRFRVPALDLRLGFTDFRMTLDANAFTISALESFADFDNTATLPALVLADANGNAVPGTENLRIVGTSGVFYPTVAGFSQEPPPTGGQVSEPASVSLALLGLAALVALRRTN